MHHQRFSTSTSNDEKNARGGDTYTLLLIISKKQQSLAIQGPHSLILGGQQRVRNAHLDGERGMRHFPMILVRLVGFGEEPPRLWEGG